MPPSSSPIKDVPYCGFYAKGKCTFGKKCRHSHDEKDSPAAKKQRQETMLQLEMKCSVCGMKIVQNNLWFALILCSHPICFTCAKKKAKKSQGCPKCSVPIEKICPSALFLDGKDKIAALEYFKSHEKLVLELYSQKTNRLTPCIFKKCSKKIILEDKTEVCPHGQFNKNELEQFQLEKQIEKEARMREEAEKKEVLRKSRNAQDTLFFIFVIIFAFTCVLVLAPIKEYLSGRVATLEIPISLPKVDSFWNQVLVEQNLMERGSRRPKIDYFLQSTVYKPFSKPQKTTIPDTDSMEYNEDYEPYGNSMNIVVDAEKCYIF